MSIRWVPNRLPKTGDEYLQVMSLQNVEKARMNSAGSLFSPPQTATIEEVNYDECVRIAAAQSARTPNSVVIQDTAWEFL